MVTRGKGFEKGKFIKVGNNGKFMSDEINTVEVIKSSPIMIRESPIRYLEHIFEDGEYLSHGIWVDAYKKELDNMEEFSQWLVKEKYILNYLNGKWQKPKDEQRQMSELYQMFLKSKEA